MTLYDDPNPFDGIPLAEPSPRVDSRIEAFARQLADSPPRSDRGRRTGNIALAVAMTLVAVAVFWRPANPSAPEKDAPRMPAAATDKLDDLIPLDRSSAAAAPDAVGRLRREVLRVAALANGIPDDSNDERDGIERRLAACLRALDALERDLEARFDDGRRRNR